CEPVRFSVERGFFAYPFELVLSCPTPGATILYTTNGAEPVLTTGIPYRGPLLLNRTLPVRAAAFRTNLLPSAVATHTYLFGTSAGTRSVPALSLVTAPDHLTGTNGIVGMQGGTRDASGAWRAVRSTDYYNPLQRGRAWERPASLEWIEAADNGGFQVDAGLRLHASDYFRPRLTPTSKFSWRLYFRGDYGAGRLEHPLLPPEIGTTAEFDALVLRAGSNDQNPFVKDELVRRLFADCGQVSARGTLGALYLNGRYAGFYNPVERVESDFLALRHGGSNAWDVLSQAGPVDGDRLDFDRMLAFVRGNDPAQEAAYQRIQRWLEVTNFIDYLLVNAYGYNGDWPQNNWRAARERREGAPWRFYVWDAEWSFGTYGRAVTGNTFTELSGSDPISTLFQRLRRSAEFRRLFADRAHRHLFNEGALSESNVRRRFGELHAAGFRIISGMDRAITNSWVRSRPAPLLSHLQGIGCLASSNAPVLRRHGGPVPAGFVLTLTNAAGTVFYTTNGIDPRVPFTGAVSAAAVAYQPARPPVVGSGFTFLARALDGTNWSALTAASFQLGEATPPVRLTEVMYHPPGGDAFEFIELR
ncbi:MAG: CotH kinase family protein, partial [Verrucomicrobiota bacterium]